MVLLDGLIVEAFVIETTDGWGNIVSLSHIEVLSEHLVSAPPVSVDHGGLLVSSNLVEVGISHVVLLSISWHSKLIWCTVVLVHFTSVPQVFINHVLLLILGQKVKSEGLV